MQPWNGQGNEPDLKSGLAPMYGTPWVGKVTPWLNLLGVPCTPPMGHADRDRLDHRKIVWQHPLGTSRDTGPFKTHDNLPLKTGIFNISGNMVTRSGLVLQAGTADDYLRAMDVTTGDVLWRARLPAGGQANPMRFAAGERQFVVLAAGGHRWLGTRTGDYLMTYALPR